MRWLTGAMVLDTDGERFVRADIGIDGERIADVVPRASPGGRTTPSSTSTAAGCCPG